LNLFLADLNWNLAMGFPGLPDQARAARGVKKRMPRPGYRWSRRRRAFVKARPVRRTKPCPVTRLQEGQRLEPQVMDIPGIRHELVSRVRQEIRAGTYDTPAKLEAALERLLTRLADD
jgi:hypothetical protein